MPTNLPPEYKEAEKKYKEASTTEEKIRTLEDLIGTIPKHKGTDKLRANYRRRLSKLKSAAETKKSVSKHESAFAIEREGAGQAAVIGLSNVGKSSIVDALTNASPEVAEYPFTTWSPTPGMMLVQNVQIQLIDTPPLDREFVEPELVDLIKRADILLIVVDLTGEPFEQYEETMAFLERHHVAPLSKRGQFPEIPRFSYKPFLILVNKCDDESSEQDFDVLTEYLQSECPLVPISATTGRFVDQMKQQVFACLDLVRVYSQAPGKEPDLHSPFVLKKGSTVEEFARKIHLDFYKNLKSARVWGSTEFDGQTVGRDYVLEDGDIVELKI
jgi:ribosome-interacting GTPase 1